MVSGGNDEGEGVLLVTRVIVEENKEATQYKLANERERNTIQPSPLAARAEDYEFSILMEFCRNSGDKRNVLI